MALLLRIVVSLVVIFIGVVLLARSYKVVHMIGTNNWAEQHLGSGGSYTLVKLIGLVFIILALLTMFGIIKPFDIIFPSK